MAIPLFPLEEAVLLPDGDLPLDISEPRYVAMVRDAMAGDRLIGMIQPYPVTAETGGEARAFYKVGCAGRITAFEEITDGHFIINLHGVTRFHLLSHQVTPRGYYTGVVDFSAFQADLHEPDPLPECLTRSCLVQEFRTYLDRQGLQVDWALADIIPDHRFYTLLAMICPFSAAEKQALLEAITLEERCRLMKDLMAMACAADRHVTFSGLPC